MKEMTNNGSKELKMFVYQMTRRPEDESRDAETTTIGVVVPEFNEWAKSAADDAIEGQTLEDAADPPDTSYLMAAVMIVDEAGVEGVANGECVVEQTRTGLAVVEEVDPRSPLIPDQHLWPDGVRLLQCVEFDLVDVDVMDGEIDEGSGEKVWLGDSDLAKPVHPAWGEGGFHLITVADSDIYSRMPFEELARCGLLRTAVEVEPNSAVLVMTEDKPPIAYVVDEDGALMEVDSREMIKTLVEAEIQHQTERIDENL